MTTFDNRATNPNRLRTNFSVDILLGLNSSSNSNESPKFPCEPENNGCHHQRSSPGVKRPKLENGHHPENGFHHNEPPDSLSDDYCRLMDDDEGD